jgi:anti-sigma-K factor RskA
VIDAHKPVTHQLTPAQARLVAAGATFAISLEPIGGSPTGHATGPIVASGKLVAT